MRIEIQPGDKGWTHAAPLLAAVWTPEVLASVPWRGVVWAHAGRRILVWDERDTLVCHVGIYLQDARWNDRAVRVGGVGGVATRQEYRRRGFAGAALRRAAEEIAHEPGADFGLLFCEPHNFSFYQDLAWHLFSGEVFAEQPQGRIRFDVMAPFVLDLTLSPRTGVLDLCGLVSCAGWRSLPRRQLPTTIGKKTMSAAAPGRAQA